MGDLTWTTKRIGEEVNRFGRAYQQFINYGERNRYLGGYLGGGYDMDFGKCGIDIGVGLGTAEHFVRYTGLPDDTPTVTAPMGFLGSVTRDVTGTYINIAIVRYHLAFMYEI